MNRHIEFEESAGNVFADLELEGAEELQARGMVGFHVIELLKSQNMKKREMAELLRIKQSEVSHLLGGHFSRFTLDKLLHFLERMHQNIIEKGVKDIQEGRYTVIETSDELDKFFAEKRAKRQKQIDG